MLLLKEDKEARGRWWPSWSPMDRFLHTVGTSVNQNAWGGIQKTGKFRLDPSIEEQIRPTAGQVSLTPVYSRLSTTRST